MGLTQMAMQQTGRTCMFFSSLYSDIWVWAQSMRLNQSSRVLQVYSLHIETWKWSEHTAEVEGEAPSPRYGHAAVALPDDRHVATFGGGDQSDDMFFSSIALLDTLTWRWSTPKVQVQPKSHCGYQETSRPESELLACRMCGLCSQCCMCLCKARLAHSWQDV